MHQGATEGEADEVVVDSGEEGAEEEEEEQVVAAGEGEQLLDAEYTSETFRGTASGRYEMISTRLGHQ
jgi:hypothetical protein